MRRVIDWFKVGHRLVFTFFVVLGAAWAIIDPSLHTIHLLYSAMWSNMWAPSIWTLAGFFIADFRQARKARMLKDHHFDVTQELAGHVTALTARLKEVIGGDDEPEDESGQDRADTDPRQSGDGNTVRSMA